MPLSSLPDALQIIEVYNFEMFSRVFWIVLMVGISSIYVFYWRPFKEEGTPFISVAFVRSFMTIFSYIILMVTPFFFFAMAPQWDVWSFIFPFFNLYIIMMIVYVITVSVDYIRFSVPVLLRIGGIKSDDPNVERVYKRFFNKNGRKV